MQILMRTVAHWMDIYCMIAIPLTIAALELNLIMDRRKPRSSGSERNGKHKERPALLLAGGVHGGNHSVDGKAGSNPID